MNNKRKIIPNGELQILSEGKLGAIVGFPVLVNSGNGHKEKMFERFVRPPGTRIIAIKDKTIFLQKEFRLELESEKKFDWRLPGGKVMDSFEEYKNYIGKELPIEMILKAGKKELREEAHLDAEKLEVFKKSTCGASVEWDLYYLIAQNITPFEHNHDEGEEITDGKWFSFEEILSMCKSREINEDRTVSALYQFISKNQVFR